MKNRSPDAAHSSSQKPISHTSMISKMPSVKYNHRPNLLVVQIRSVVNGEMGGSATVS
jgi:hypothetical protein